MNLNNNPVPDQLRALLQTCDDIDGDHILWVDGPGEVHITLQLTEIRADWIKRMNAEVQFQYETYAQNNEGGRMDAAYDGLYVTTLFAKLIKDWQGHQNTYSGISNAVQYQSSSAAAFSKDSRPSLIEK